MVKNGVTGATSDRLAQSLRISVPARGASADTSKREPITPATVIEAMKARPVMHAPTGIAALDELTNGGPRFCDVVAVLGAPDAGKTTVATALADHYSSSDCIVGFCCFDDDEEDLATRLAQRRNWTRADVEARVDFDVLLEQMPTLHIYDAMWSVESVVEDLAKRADHRRVVLIVDSLQTMNVAAAANANGKADAIGAGLRVLRNAAKFHRWLVVFTSEMVRGSYSGVGEKTAALAAAKWSGDVEYVAKLVLAVRNEADTPDLLHVEVPKNKPGGRKGEFYLKLDRAHQRLEATSTPDKDEQQREKKAAKVAIDEKERTAALAKLTQIVLKNPGIGVRQLRMKAAAADLGGRDRIDMLVELAIDSGQIIDRPIPRGKVIDRHYHVPSSSDPGATS